MEIFILSPNSDIEDEMKDHKWVESRINTYILLTGLFLVLPWIMFVMAFVLYWTGISKAMESSSLFNYAVGAGILGWVCVFMAGWFLLFTWFDHVSNVKANLDILRDMVVGSNKEIWVEDYNPYGNITNEVPLMVIFGSNGGKYPESFYVTIHGTRRWYQTGGMPVYPYISIAIPFGPRPQVLIFDGETRIRDEKIKKEIEGRLPKTLPMDYVLSILRGTGMAGLSLENRLTADYFQRPKNIKDVFKGLEILEMVKNACYGDNPVNPRSSTKFGPYDVALIYYCPGCKKVISIEGLNLDFPKTRKCEKCGSEEKLFVQRLSQK